MANDTPLRIPNKLIVEGDLEVQGTLLPGITRAGITQEGSQVYGLTPERWRVFDAMGSNLPSTSASDDLGIYGGTAGTNFPYIGTGDVKAAGAITRYARCVVCLPPEYVAGESIFLRAIAGMITTIADGTATIDFSVFASDGDGTPDATGDRVSTAATSINSTTFANKDFALDATNLAPGSWLDILMTIAVNDAATGTAVIAAVFPQLMLSIKG